MLANSTQNEDLFWAIRGGGCNFGICTEFTFRLYEQRRTAYFGCLTFFEEQLEAVQAATYKWWCDGPSENEAIYQFLQISPSPASKVRTVQFPYSTHPHILKSDDPPPSLLLCVMSFITAPRRREERSSRCCLISVSYPTDTYKYLC